MIFKKGTTVRILPIRFWEKFDTPKEAMVLGDYKIRNTSNQTFGNR
jgi:hypothetical protein